MSDQAQSVNIRLHEIAERLIDHSMALEGVGARKALRHDPDLEVPASVPGSGMADVQVALVDDVQLFRQERRLQARTNGGDSVAAHGRTCRTGLIRTSENTPSNR